MTEIIRLGTGDLEIEVWTLGARLNGVWFQGVGPLVDGATNEDEARGAKKYNGAVVGPVANRIAGGKASIDGRTHTFERNEKGITTLHSGSTGVHAQEWEVLRRTADRLVMQLVLPDGLGGFPATRSLQADYHVGATGFTTVFTATTDAPTWMNLALHPYWRLSHGGRDNMKMAIAADRYTPVDKDQIPLGTEEDVDRTLFDLRALGVPSD
ncbi:MAG: galactose mutarotase, partial [Pseudomonadota bacterium]